MTFERADYDEVWIFKRTAFKNSEAA